MWSRLRRLAGQALGAASGPEAASSHSPTTARGHEEVRASAEAIYYNVAMMRLNAQLTQVDTIDAKASAMFTIGSTILPITAALLTSDPNIVANCPVSKYALVAGSISYVVLVGAFTWSYRLAQWDSRPELGQWRTLTVGRREDEIQRWLGDACVAAYVANKPQLEKKARLVAAVLWCVAFEAAGLTVAVLAPLF